MGMDGTYLQGITTVVHNWTQIDFNNFVYSAVYFGESHGADTVVINGTALTQVAGVTIPMLVQEKNSQISGDTVYLLGNPKPQFTGSFDGVAPEIEYITKYSMYLDFNDSQWFNCGTLPNYAATSITVSMWIQPEEGHPPATPGDGYTIDTYSGGEGFALVQDRGGPAPGPPGLWAFFIGVGAGITRIDGVTPIEEDTWYHVVGTWNEVTKDFKLYVNGVEDASDTLGAVSIIDSGQILRLGANTNNSGEYNGLMNNGAIWYTALTDDEVLEIFNGGLPLDLKSDGPQKSSLVSWWKLGDNASWDGTDWHIPDQTGVNNGISDNGGGAGSHPMKYSNRKINAPGD